MPVTLFHGDNGLEIDEAVRTLRATFQLADVLSFEGSEVTLPALAEACLTAGLFEPERLVIVSDLHQRIKGKDSTELEEIRSIMGNVVPTTTLLLASRGMAGDHPLLFAVREVGGKVKAFETPRKGDLPRWIVSRGQQHKVEVDLDAAELLADMVGADPQMLESELEKLATYAGENARITPRMVETLVGAVTQDSIFTLVDAVAAGDRAAALRLLHAQLDHASSTPIDFALGLIRLLARQMRILLQIRVGREVGRSTSQLTTELKLPRYYADKYMRQAGRLSKERLRASFEQLAALEYGLKSGTADAVTGLDLLVTDLCA